MSCHRIIDGLDRLKLDGAHATNFDFINASYHSINKVLKIAVKPTTKLSPGKAADVVFPLPSVFVPNAKGHRGKQQESLKRSRAVCQLMNLSIFSLNQLFFGVSSHVVSGRRDPSRLQRRFHSNIRAAMMKYVDGLGQEEVVLTPPSGDPGEYGVPTRSSAAERLKVDALDLPRNAGGCDILELFDVLKVPQEVRDLIENPPVNEDVRYESLPKQVLLSSADTWGKVVDRGYECGLLSFKRETDIAHVLDDQGRDRPLINGAFGVPKSNPNQQRFICSLTASNACLDLSRLPDIRLPTQDMMTSLLIKPGQCLRTSKIDVASCFFQFRVPESASRWFGLIPPEEGMSKHCPPGMVPVLTVCPMGWALSVHVIQILMECVVTKEAGLPESAMLNRGPVEVSPVVHGICLDDWFVIGTAGRKSRELAVQWAHRVLSAWKRLKIPVHEDKIFLDNECQEVLGMLIHGSYIERAPEKRFGLFVSGIRLLFRHSFQTSDRATLLGKMVHCFLVKRPLLSCFSSDTFVKCYDISKVLSVWCDESWFEILWGLCLLPLAVCNVGLPISNLVFSSDAMSVPVRGKEGINKVGLGAGYTYMKRDVVEAQLRAALGKKGWRTSASDLYLGEEVCVHLESVFSEKEMRSTHWSKCYSFKYESREHITRSEGVAFTLASKAHTVREGRCIRLFLCDNSSVVGAWAKGRSGSRALNSCIRQSAVYDLCSGSKSCCVYVSSAANFFADYLSRR